MLYFGTYTFNKFHRLCSLFKSLRTITMEIPLLFHNTPQPCPHVRALEISQGSFKSLPHKHVCLPVNTSSLVI